MNHPSTRPSEPQRPAPWSGLRWWICGLLFLATTVNYLDRQSLSFLKPKLKDELGWNEADYGWIAFAFQTAYAIFQPVAGRVIDVVGVRLTLAVALVLWSLAAVGHGLVGTVLGFAVMRFLLGTAEAANFPASIKAVAQWFPQRERALATGIFNSGSNVGIILAALMTVPLAQRFGWQTAFVVIGSVGFVWLAVWLALFQDPQKHPRLSAAERAHIEVGQKQVDQQTDIPWLALLRYREVWPFLLVRFMTDPVWWFYLFWLPSYLKDARGLSLADSASKLVMPYIAADVGSIFGGWLSGHLMKRGWRTWSARYLALLVCAVAMPGAIVAVTTAHLWLALGLISLATAAHQGWSANLYTAATDVFPSKVAGSVIGLAGMSAAIGGMLMTLLVGGTLQWFHSYTPIFVWAGVMHPLGLLIFRWLAGAMKPVNLDQPVNMAQPCVPLLAGGAAACVAGAVAVTLLGLNWNYFVSVTKTPSAPAGGITAAAGVAFIGLILIYAGLGRRRPADGR